MKRSFFQAAVVSILLYGSTTWTLTKRLEKKLDGNYTRMLRAILSKFWRQHPTRHLPSRKLSKSDEPDMQDNSGEAGASSKVMYSYGPPHIAEQKQDDQLEHTHSSYVRIRDVVLKTCRRRCTIGRSDERGSGISVPVARHDDDNIYIIKIIIIFLLFEAKNYSKSYKVFNLMSTFSNKFFSLNQ